MAKHELFSFVPTISYLRFMDQIALFVSKENKKTKPPCLEEDQAVFYLMSGIRELNPCLNLGKVMLGHSTNPAYHNFILSQIFCQNPFSPSFSFSSSKGGKTFTTSSPGFCKLNLSLASFSSDSSVKP